MVVKGFIDYKSGKIPFVLENYKMELFSEDALLGDFIKEHNFKNKYILTGHYFRMGTTAESITILVGQSMGATCYVECFILERLRHDSGFDCINFQSRSLDSIFKYKYNFIDLSRTGVNLSCGEYEVYKIPFTLENYAYDLTYKIGQNTKLGMLEDFSSWGISSIPLKTGNINECYKLSALLERFSKFLINHSHVPFKKIVLSQKGFPVGWFYYKNISDEPFGDFDGLFQDFDVDKYSSKILNNISQNIDNKIVASVPLGHLSNYDNTFAPQRFIEQVMSFEYIYQKLYPSKNNSALAEKLKNALTEFPKAITGNRAPQDIANEIKELRRRITHGYEYYYSFENDPTALLNISLLDRLIKMMSLKLIGFSSEDIEQYNAMIY